MKTKKSALNDELRVISSAECGDVGGADVAGRTEPLQSYNGGAKSINNSFRETFLLTATTPLSISSEHREGWKRWFN